ncbi:MAG: hypothetical protein EOO20_23010 [Chryseobacterium sp.]|nr:MAG: hypothetical protein EOO20_23010 [Chryseobacterium sp.]
MEVLFLATRWGYDHMPTEKFMEKMLTAGYDGFDVWLPEYAGERNDFTRLLRGSKMPVVCQQYQAKGNTIKEFCVSFEYYLNQCLEWRFR